MIFARITLKGESMFHGSGEVTGSPAGDNYRMRGWFPVESFDFGFNDSDSKNKPPAGNPPGGGAGGGGQKAAAPPKQPGGPEEKKDTFSSMQLAKSVDRASCFLMVLAMQERSQKKGGNKELEYHADIHVVGSVAFKGQGDQDRFAYPSLMIHLEGVHVTQWKVSGSGDGRPSESLTLRYDRAAMDYVWTDDGREFRRMGPKGWNQTENKQWPEDSETLSKSIFEEFLPT